MILRVSAGTLAVLGLLDIKLQEKPRVAYLLQYSTSGCRAGCLFCAQSRELFRRRGGEYLGRVPWPAVGIEVLAKNWKGVFERICLQTVVKPGFAEEALELIRRIRSFEELLPISLATTPVSKSYLEEVRDIGVDALGVGLDTATSELFEKWGKPYSWFTYLRFIEKSVGVFGRGNVYVHIIVGLGETLRDMVKIIRRLYSMGARVALFNYVNECGLSPVDIRYYRLVQIARFLVESGLDPDAYIDYDRQVISRELGPEVMSAFYTSGCPGCNRPFYNEKPSGPLYNIPSESALRAYMDKLRVELASIGVSL